MNNICIKRQLSLPNKVSKSHEYKSLEDMIDVIKGMLTIKEFSPKTFFQIDEIEIDNSIYVEGYPIRVMGRIVNGEDNPGILPLDIEDMNDDNFEIISDIIRQMADTRNIECYSHMITYTPQIITIHEGVTTRTKLIINCKFGGTT